MKPTVNSTCELGKHRSGFTLTEILVAMSIGLVVLGAVVQTVVVIGRLVHKNQVVTHAVSDTRLVQAHLNRELAVAKSQTINTPYVRPRYGGPSPTQEDGLTYNSELTYRVPIGSFARVVSAAGNSITLDCAVDLKPQAGDFIEISAPSLGRNCRIVSVNDTRSPNTAGNVTLTIDKTVNEAQENPPTTAPSTKDNRSFWPTPPRPPPWPMPPPKPWSMATR